jgi:hypothetical protein
MNSQRLAVGISLFFAMSGACLASTTISQGVIEFRGSLVESSCATGIGANSTVELSDCATSARGGNVSAHRVEPARSVSALDPSSVDVKLLSESRQGEHYYDQQYALVDGAGKPVTAGNYLITLTAP